MWIKIVFEGGNSLKVWAHKIVLTKPFKVILYVHRAFTVDWLTVDPDDYTPKDFVPVKGLYSITDPATGRAVVMTPKPSIRQAVEDAKFNLRILGKEKYFNIVEKVRLSGSHAPEMVTGLQENFR